MCSNAYFLEIFYGDTVSIDSPVDDDIFAAGSMVKINAPVDSATVVGGALYLNAPVERDLIAAGGEVQIESDVGGKIMVAGGNINLGGDVGTNLVAAGGNVNLQPTANVARDALITAGRVLNAGTVNGTLTVRSNDFNNIGSAGAVDYQMIENPQDRRESQTRFHLFSLLTTLGWLILGLILLKFLPGLFNAVEREIKQSIAVKTGMGFVFIIAICIAILITAITIVGLPIAIISALSMIVALMLTGIFVSFSLGSWIGNRLNLQYSDMILFIIGFVLLNMLFILPLVGWLLSLISICLGFGAFLYVARKNLPKLSEKFLSP
ncbi:MAG: hypothetical protein MUO26_04420 [Methanotrichaceae archaeon]|nr:hypothetical protein [Methanotrichaceae archaeon]